ncbi:N-acetyltransferase [Puniceicoccales bacterium CK1056]|uniref:N-acetyltransferase n=1 Tax=Oceanipulchritudo coccoides TaxID=2706888 RepID=A0A6B2M0R4_9BACT|nr:N-acetyltransferase [Oceanipulchritudo coccoides]NDV61946.1 N-acetyltransferase [Oceanipulchritudo coccoides]
MIFRRFTADETAPIVSLVREVFGSSEGEAEGELIGKLTSDLISGTSETDLHGFVATDGARIIGAILFTRITIRENTESFIMAPVAVHCDYQGKGIGQRLIRHGLDTLRKETVQFVISYGDPNYYSKVGFQQISPEVIRPPLKLSLPHGWIGQSLTDESIDKLSGDCICVEALSDPAYW